MAEIISAQNDKFPKHKKYPKYILGKNEVLTIHNFPNFTVNIFTASRGSAEEARKLILKECPIYSKNFFILMRMMLRYSNVFNFRDDQYNEFIEYTHLHYVNARGLNSTINAKKFASSEDTPAIIIERKSLHREDTTTIFYRQKLRDQMDANLPPSYSKIFSRMMIYYRFYNTILNKAKFLHLRRM